LNFFQLILALKEQLLISGNFESGINLLRSNKLGVKTLGAEVRLSQVRLARNLGVKQKNLSLNIEDSNLSKEKLLLGLC